MPNSSYNGTGSYLGTVGGTTNVYSTSLPGIGVQLSFSNGSQQFPLIQSGNPMSPYHYAPNPSWALTVKLVKTGPIPAGGAITGEIGQGWLADASYGNQFQYASIQLSSSIIFTPTTPTCTVTSPSNIPVSVGSASANSFTGVGSTSSTVTPFSINLSCSGGTSGLTTNMYITLTDQTNPGNTSNVLSLNPASLASGVGIQLRKADNSIISYGPDSNVPGNINQWFVQNTGNGTVTIPLTARLIQTDAHVNPGTVVAYATYTLSYQ
jgi:type 1 fimbria pilin